MSACDSYNDGAGMKPVAK